MTRKIPPFRADIVGSFLRPQAIKQARGQFNAGEITAEQLKVVEDTEIAKIVAQQEALGLQSATDGEFRRSFWHIDFFVGLTGFEYFVPSHGCLFRHGEIRAGSVRVVGKVAFPDNHPFLEHFKFLKSCCKTAVPKQTIPSPSLLYEPPHASQCINRSVYPDLEDYYTDVGNAFKKAVDAFYAIGCRYLQIDDPSWPPFDSPELLPLFEQAGENLEHRRTTYVRMLNTLLANKPDDLVVTIHTCRGNYKSDWWCSGSYRPIATTLFRELPFDGYFLEYDTERCGDFEPLKLLPPNKFAVLGIVTSKSEELEDAKAIKARIEEASKYAPKEQFCLSTQCGFASTEEGNLLTEEEQWAKIRFIVQLAKEIW
jgi:5-methyltetrahydropteroyltriglutamate--homocysteine methyltransferase